MTRTIARTAATVFLAAVLSLSASSSFAGTKAFEDPTGDTDNSGLFDIGKVTVKNTKTFVSVKFTFPPNEYVPGPDGSFEVLIDSNQGAPGAELSWSAPLFSEFSIVPVRNGKHLHRKEWLPNTPKPTKCGKNVRIDWNPPKGYGRLKIFKKSGCLGKATKIRVNVMTTVTGERADYGEPTTYTRPELDYYPSKGKYSSWVRR